MATPLDARPPLEDPSYTPRNPPIDGRVPDVVERWGPASQLRWFRRFGSQLGPQTGWHRWYCMSLRHRGGCCFSCDVESGQGYGVRDDGYCCCHDGRGSVGSLPGRGRTPGEEPQR